MTDQGAPMTRATPTDEDYAMTTDRRPPVSEEPPMRCWLRECDELPEDHHHPGRPTWADILAHRRESEANVIEAIRQFVAGDPQGGNRERTLMFLDGLDFVADRKEATDD